VVRIGGDGVARARDPKTGKFKVAEGTTPAPKRGPVKRPGSRRWHKIVATLCGEVERVHGTCSAYQEMICRQIADIQVELEKAKGQEDYHSPLTPEQFEQFTRGQNAVARGLRMLRLKPTLLAPPPSPRPVPSLSSIIKQQAASR
jgi:hypothetical protein